MWKWQNFFSFPNTRKNIFYRTYSLSNNSWSSSLFTCKTWLKDFSDGKKWISINIMLLENEKDNSKTILVLLMTTQISSYILSFKAYRNVWPYSNAPVANRSHLQLTGHITWLLQYSTIYDGFPTIFKLPVIEVQMLNAKNGDTE